MPSRPPRIPSYRLHKASGQAVVTLDGRDVYLGPHGSPESYASYHAAISRWQIQSRLPEAVALSKPVLAISELFLAYWEFAQLHYRKDGKRTGELAEIRYSVRELLTLHGGTFVNEFGPLALKTVRQAMIESDLSRGVINQRIGRIKRMFKWGVENELVQPTTLHGLQSVSGLQRGRTAAREAPPVRPACASLVESVLPHLSTPVAAMVRLQMLSGMRPGEIAILRPCDVDRNKSVWVYRPASHKTEHHGKERRIFLGPKAQDVLSPFLLRPHTAYCFSPREAMEEHQRHRAKARNTPLSCGNREGSNRKTNPIKKPGEHYDTKSYRRAVIYACDKLSPPPTELAGDALADWRKEHRFHPHQLRHNAATYLTREFGIEAAQTVLGHASLEITQVYAERDYEKAAEVMRQVG